MLPVADDYEGFDLSGDEEGEGEVGDVGDPE